MRADEPITFGDYLLWERIRIGGMAELWRATRRTGGEAGKVLAIKRTLPTVAEDRELSQLFFKEAELSRRLKHKNIVRAYDSGSVGASHFIAMEYVHGQDLRALLDRAKLKGEQIPVAASCFIIAQACDGLDYAHRAVDENGVGLNVVHQDVSPQNILISYQGEVKVADFGVAANERLIGCHPPRGKAAYMSPEQRQGLPTDRRTDIFAIGVCLYELLTGRRPSSGRLQTSGESAPAAGLAIKALQEDPGARQQTAREMADQLREHAGRTGFGERELGQYLSDIFG